MTFFVTLSQIIFLFFNGSLYRHSVTASYPRNDVVQQYVTNQRGAFFCVNNVDLVLFVLIMWIWSHWKVLFASRIKKSMFHQKCKWKNRFFNSYNCFEKQLLIFQWKLVQIWRKVARGFFNRRSHCIARYSYEGRGGRLHLCFRHFLRTPHILPWITFYDHIII